MYYGNISQKTKYSWEEGNRPMTFCRVRRNLHNKFDILDRSLKPEIFSGFSSYFHNCKLVSIIVMTSYVYKVNLSKQLPRKNQRFKDM